MQCWLFSSGFVGQWEVRLGGQEAYGFIGEAGGMTNKGGLGGDCVLGLAWGPKSSPHLAPQGSGARVGQEMKRGGPLATHGKGGG